MLRPTALRFRRDRDPFPSARLKFRVYHVRLDPEEPLLAPRQNSASFGSELIDVNADQQASVLPGRLPDLRQVPLCRLRTKKTDEKFTKIHSMLLS